MFAALTVAPSDTFTKLKGFVVTVLYRAPFEDNWERLTHPAVFTTSDRAQAFANKVKKSGYNIDFSKWVLPTDTTSYIRNDVNPEFFLVANS